MIASRAYQEDDAILTKVPGRGGCVCRWETRVRLPGTQQWHMSEGLSGASHWQPFCNSDVEALQKLCPVPTMLPSLCSSCLIHWTRSVLSPAEGPHHCKFPPPSIKEFSLYYNIPISVKALQYTVHHWTTWLKLSGSTYPWIFLSVITLENIWRLATIWENLQINHVT